MRSQSTSDQIELVSGDLVRLLKKNQRTSFYKKKLTTGAVFRFYLGDRRIVMLEDDTLQENTTLLLNLRHADKTKCVDLILEGVYKYIAESPISTKLNTKLSLYKKSFLQEDLIGLINRVTYVTSTEITTDTKFRGTACAFMTMVIKVEHVKGEVSLAFTLEQKVYNLADLSLERLFKDSFEESPSISNALTYEIKISLGL